MLPGLLIRVVYKLNDNGAKDDDPEHGYNLIILRAQQRNSVPCSDYCDHFSLYVFVVYTTHYEYDIVPYCIPKKA